MSPNSSADRSEAAPASSVSPVAHARGVSGGSDADGPAALSGADPAPLLFTPAQAAQLLQVRESWLRRRAARRLVPCTFLGKHLRFSRADLDAVAAGVAPSPDRDAARPRPRGRRRPGVKGHVRKNADSHDRFGDEHI